MMACHSFARIMRLYLVTAVLAALLSACAGSSATSGSAEPQKVTIEKDTVYGTGPFSLPDARTGLADLSSYTATLIVSFDGTRAGAPEAWSKTYVMVTSTEPEARQLTIEKTGAAGEPEAFFALEMPGLYDERRGAGRCSPEGIETGGSLSERYEPAGFLDFVIGAEEAGTATVNEITATGYTFDQRALGEDGVSESTGEVWVASDGGYIVKYLLTRQASADYFGEGVEGTLSLDYELSAVNQPVTISVPQDCPAAFVDVPLPPGASNVVNNPGNLGYDSSTSMADAAASLEKTVTDLGWEPFLPPTASDTQTVLGFTRAGETMMILLTVTEGTTSVNIFVEPAPAAN